MSTPPTSDADGRATGGQAGGRLEPGARRTLRSEVLLVLALSLAASAAFSVLDLLSEPLRGVSRATFSRAGLPYQLLGIAVDLVPVALVAHFLARSGESMASIGLDRRRPGADLAWGAGLAALTGAAGVAVYAAGVSAGLNRAVVPVPPLGQWWTVPVLVLGAARAGLLEEVLFAYTLRRLAQLDWPPARALWATALLRAVYHLYQGWGGFLGNLALGLVFGRVYQARGRAMPLVVAHFLLDAAAGLGYLALRGKVSWLPA